MHFLNLRTANDFHDVTLKLKVDDDVFVNPETLWSTLQSPPLRSAKLKLKDTNTTDVQYSIIGRMIKYGRPILYFS